MQQSSPSSIADRIAALPHPRRGEVHDLLEHLETLAPETPGVSPTIFLSHVAAHIREANNYKENLRRPAFLSSDWESLRIGGSWIQEVILAIRCCREFEALIFDSTNFANLWMNFELGVALGVSARYSPTKPPKQ